MSTDLGMGWREVFPILSLGVLLVTLPVILLLTIDKPDDYEQSTGASEATNIPLTTTMLLKDSGFWMLGICVAIMYGMLVGILSNIVQIGMKSGLSLPDAMLTLSYLALGGFIGKLTVGFLSDRINNCLLMALVLCIFAASLLPPLRADGTAPLYLGSFIIGFSAISSLPLWHSLTARLFGVANFARVIGLTQPMVLTMTFVCPLIIAKVFDLTGSFDYALAACSVSLLLATPLVIGIGAKEKRVLAAA